MITDTALKQMLPRNSRYFDWLDALNLVLPKFEITTNPRIAAFIAETAHESADYTRLVENLNYSANGLMATWPSRFRTTAIAAQYARQPEKIANLVYCGRLGNSNDITLGEGWKYRGRGIIQLTGKGNYSRYSKMLFGDERLVDTPELLLTHDVAVSVACAYWNDKNLNKYADELDIDTISRKINGGNIGLKERRTRFAANLAILGEQ